MPFTILFHKTGSPPLGPWVITHLHKLSVLNAKSTGELQKVRELPEVITKCNAAVRSSQETTHTSHQILKGLRTATPKR